MLENSVVGLLTRYQNITYVLHLMKMRSRAPMEDRLCPMFHTVNLSCFAETKIRIYHVSFTNMTTTLIRFLLLLSTIKVAGEKAVRGRKFPLRNSTDSS